MITWSKEIQKFNMVWQFTYLHLHQRKIICTMRKSWSWHILLISSSKPFIHDFWLLKNPSITCSLCVHVDRWFYLYLNFSLGFQVNFLDLQNSFVFIFLKSYQFFTNFKGVHKWNQLVSYQNIWTNFLMIGDSNFFEKIRRYM